MTIVWKDNTHTEAIFYRKDDEYDHQIINPVKVEELMKEPLMEDEFILQLIHSPGFDGPWPTQEQLNYTHAHRFDWMKDMKLVYL